MHWLAVLACAFFAATTLWESFGPARSGHFSTSAAYAMAGENMVHWEKFAIYGGYLLKPATPDQYYCHHPYGIVVMQAIAYLLFGHHWFTARAGAMFSSIIAAPSLYGFGRKAWGIIPASVATIYFVFCPIDISYATFSNLEEPTIGFALLLAWATAKAWETSQTRYVVISAIGALGTANGDWAGLVLLMPVVGFAFFRAYIVPRRWYGRLDEAAFAKWFAWVTAMAVCSVVAYLYFFQKADKINDFLGSYKFRSSGSEAPVADVLSQKRKYWLAITLTPLTYGAIAVGIPLSALRLFRKPLEIFPLAFCFAATFQYFIFKQAADIHIFWPHYYGPTAALASGSLAATLLAGRGALVGLVDKAARWRESPAFPRFVRNTTAAIVVAALGIPLLLLVRMGIPLLVQSRKTGGRMDHMGHYINTDADMAQFAEWAFSNVATLGSTVQVLEKYDYSFASEYGGNRPYARVSSLTVAKPEDPQRIALVDTRNQTPKDLENIAKTYGVQSVGDFWRVDRAQKGPDLKALKYDEHEPNVLEWMFISGTDLVRKISRDEDPFRTWQLRDAFNLPATAPSVQPVSIDDLRIAHNVAVRAGDTARAKEIFARVAGRVGTPRAIKYSGGVELQGVEVHDGPAIVLTLYWSTDDTFKPKDVTYQLKCKLLRPPPLWPTQIAFFDQDMAPTPLVRPAVWKAGSLYTQRFIVMHRIGVEECRGSFSGDFVSVGDPAPVLLTMY